MLDAPIADPLLKRHYCDEEPLPEWGKGPDGRFVIISADERLPQLYKAWRDGACDHPLASVVCEPDSLGRNQYFERCDHCGLKLTSAISHSEARKRGISELTRDDMEQRAKVYVARRREAFARLTQDAAERCQPENRRSHDDYLRSPEWKRRRAKIIERAKGTCEGCLTKPAEEVHHLSYDHFGAEFAFELVALCSPCHRRWHERSAG